jgi:hypothetical protein
VEIPIIEGSRWCFDRQYRFASLPVGREAHLSAKLRE